MWVKRLFGGLQKVRKKQVLMKDISEEKNGERHGHTTCTQLPHLQYCSHCMRRCQQHTPCPLLPGTLSRLRYGSQCDVAGTTFLILAFLIAGRPDPVLLHSVGFCVNFCPLIARRVSSVSGRAWQSLTITGRSPIPTKPPTRLADVAPSTPTHHRLEVSFCSERSHQHRWCS